MEITKHAQNTRHYLINSNTSILPFPCFSYRPGRHPQQHGPPPRRVRELHVEGLRVRRQAGTDRSGRRHGDSRQRCHHRRGMR